MERTQVDDSRRAGHAPPSPCAPHAPGSRRERLARHNEGIGQDRARRKCRVRPSGNPRTRRRDSRRRDGALRGSGRQPLDWRRHGNRAAAAGRIHGLHARRGLARRSSGPRSRRRGRPDMVRPGARRTVLA